MTEPVDRGSDHVRSPARGLAVIKAFGATSPELTLSEVARATGLTRAAARTESDLHATGTLGGTTRAFR